MVNFPTYFFAMGEDMNVVVVLNVGKQDEGGWVFFLLLGFSSMERRSNESVRTQEQQKESHCYTKRQ